MDLFGIIILRDALLFLKSNYLLSCDENSLRFDEQREESYMDVCIESKFISTMRVFSQDKLTGKRNVYEKIKYVDSRIYG